MFSGQVHHILSFIKLSQVFFVQQHCLKLSKLKFLQITCIISIKLTKNLSRSWLFLLQHVAYFTVLGDWAVIGYQSSVFCWRGGGGGSFSEWIWAICDAIVSSLSYNETHSLKRPWRFTVIESIAPKIIYWRRQYAEIVCGAKNMSTQAQCGWCACTRYSNDYFFACTVLQ